MSVRPIAASILCFFALAVPAFAQTAPPPPAPSGSPSAAAAGAAAGAADGGACYANFSVSNVSFY